MYGVAGDKATDLDQIGRFLFNFGNPIISDLVLPTLEGRFDLPNIRMTDHINEANDQTPFITSQSRLSRIYPRFTLYSALFSTNFQPEPYLHAGTTFISMNFNNTDNGLQRYMEAFGVDGIKYTYHSSPLEHAGTVATVFPQKASKSNTTPSNTRRTLHFTR